MKIIIYLFFIIFTTINPLYSQVKLSDIDSFRKISDKKSVSIIESGTEYCNDFFNPKKNLDKKNFYSNTFFCKFSKKRNRFYIYMVAQYKNDNLSVKEFCEREIKEKEIISDHITSSLGFQNIDYLKGFYVDNIFNNEVMSFSKNFKMDKLKIKNEINKFISQERESFTADNISNNKNLKKQIDKLDKVYKKIIRGEESNLDKVIFNELALITRYKIFINDAKKYLSYSCNWKPGKGFIPYVKREKFSEFENI